MRESTVKNVKRRGRNNTELTIEPHYPSWDGDHNRRRGQIPLYTLLRILFWVRDTFILLRKLHFILDWLYLVLYLLLYLFCSSFQRPPVGIFQHFTADTSVEMNSIQCDIFCKLKGYIKCVQYLKGLLLLFFQSAMNNKSINNLIQKRFRISSQRTSRIDWHWVTTLSTDMSWVGAMFS